MPGPHVSVLSSQRYKKFQSAPSGKYVSLLLTPDSPRRRRRLRVVSNSRVAAHRATPRRGARCVGGKVTRHSPLLSTWSRCQSSSFFFFLPNQGFGFLRGRLGRFFVSCFLCGRPFCFLLIVCIWRILRSLGSRCDRLCDIALPAGDPGPAPVGLGFSWHGAVAESTAPAFGVGFRRCNA